MTTRSEWTSQRISNDLYLLLGLVHARITSLLLLGSFDLQSAT
jgi:hypothetical protein